MTAEHSFANRWSDGIEQHGYTSIPTLLMKKRKVLNISIPEMVILLCIESFRWNRNEPWPSMSSLAQRAQLSTRATRSHVSSLETKGHIIRKYRIGTSSTYSLEPLIFKLNQMAISSLPPGKKLPPGADEINRSPRKQSSDKEYSSSQDALNNKNNKNEGVVGIRKIIADYNSKSNDFGNKGTNNE